MSRTTRRHEAQQRAAHRGPKNKPEDDLRPVLKSAKQRRSNDRIKLRREYL